MDDGIHSVSVISHGEQVGAAVPGLKDRTIRGVGQGYFWQSSYSEEDDTMQVNAYYQKDKATIFAEHDRYTAEMRRDKEQPGLVYSGRPEQEPGRTLTLKFTWQGPLG